MTIFKQNPACYAIIVIFIGAVSLAAVLIVRGMRYSGFAARTQVGDFKIGTPAPFIPGEELTHPYHVVPPSRFYVYVWQPGLPVPCVYEECGDGGEVVATLRGWLWGTDFDEFISEHYHLPRLKSLVLVADRDSMIVGIYPDAQVSDIPRILKKHPELADFGLLAGVRRLGALEVGEPLPFTLTGKTRENPNFLFLIVHETIEEYPYCPYYECGTKINLIGMLGGSFHSFDHDSPEIIKQLGLSSHQVARGEITAVIIADADARIASIHPNKDMRDVFTILKQHPELVDMQKIYRE